jgi:Tubulin like
MAMQALVMGFGGTGAHVLTALKELTVLKHGRVPETIKFLLFDTIADWKPGIAVQIVGGGGEETTAESEDEAASLDPLTEYFQLVDFAPDLRTHVFDYLLQAGNPDAHPHLKDWLHAPWLSEHVPPHQLAITIGAAQQRQIGRYAMFKNADKIVAHLRPIIRNLSDLAKGADVNVWLIGSSAGGTGAGCLIDAAYLTRLAAGDNIKLKVSGVIVLPNVYMNVRGISQGRAYSLLRELERVQEQGIPQGDRYVDMRKQALASSRVVYDRNGQQVAMVKSRLFDDLFYLGSDCPTEDERRKFFTSVASAIDPYLDAQSGPTLLEKAVNDNAAASAFGAARIYVPTETFAQMFAWEQVAEYLRRAGAPKEVGDRVERLHAGSEQDRADSATEKFRNLLELFKQLLDLEGKPERAKEAFARSELDARRIVTLWYQLTGSARSPEEQAVLLTYAEPYYSLVEPERPKDSKEWETRTYKENAASPNGVKEKQEESRARFADKLEEVRKRYLNPNGGERTFEKGRRHVLETISKRLQTKVDELFTGELERRRAEFAQTQGAPEQGTALTQLYAELTWMLGDDGPLRKVHAVIGQFVNAVAREQSERDDRYTRALQELRESKKSGMFGLGVWVEDYQQAARDECSAYISWYQKHELLKNMQQLVLNVEQRLREWERLLGQLFDALVRREARREGEASALFTVTQLHLKGTLEGRLYRAARNRSALISLGQHPDPEMHGYQEALRSQSATGLAAALLSSSHWEAARAADGTPTVTLVIDSPALKGGRYSPRELRGLPHDLYQLFYKRIEERLGNTDVFDYLIWLRENKGIEPEAVVKLLNSESNALINAGGVPESRTLVYREPDGGSKKDLADSMPLKLGTLDGIERAYSDPNAITLIKIKKPSLDQITDIEDCREDYSKLRSDRLNNNEAHDKELRRAQVFHPFRQELEAWYIERYYLKKVNSADVAALPPRVVRLLEDPEMMQIFVHGVATGAVERVAAGWVWHGPDRDVFLTSNDEDPNADVVKAAVIFALRQGEGRRMGLTDIPRDAARQSVNKRAQAKGRTRDEMLVKFEKDKLEKFLNEYAPQPLRAPLKMVFTFYCDPSTRTGLEHRVELP